jgi:hypothetical protein
MMSDNQKPEPLLPLPRAPTSPEEVADYLRGLSDVMGAVIASLIGRGLLDAGLMIDGLRLHANLARENDLPFRAAPIEYAIWELGQLTRGASSELAAAAKAWTQPGTASRRPN